MAGEVKGPRSRERLIEVIQSFGNGTDNATQAIFAFSVVALMGDDLRESLIRALGEFVASHPSDHIRSLAADALYYLKEG